MEINQTRTERRASRRDARKRLPIETLPYKPLKNFLPPVQMLSEDQVEQLHQASMHILENIGMKFKENFDFDGHRNSKGGLAQRNPPQSHE